MILAPLRRANGTFAKLTQPVVLLCDGCGATFTREPHINPNSLRRFCSAACYRISGYREADNPRWKGGKVAIVCQSCGITFQRHPSQKARFCSKQCHADSMRIFPTPRDQIRDANRRAQDRRRALLRPLGRHTHEQWEALVRLHKGKCAMCRRRRVLTRDHIIALTKGGSDHITNIQPLCRPCNSRKWNRRTQLL